MGINTLALPAMAFIYVTTSFLFLCPPGLMSFADRRRSSGAFIEGRKLSIHSGESFRSHAGK